MLIYRLCDKIILVKEMDKKKRLYKTEGTDAKVFGVCGGIAEYFDIDPTLVRIIWVIMMFAFGTGLLAYIVCALCMPRKSEIK